MDRSELIQRLRALIEEPMPLPGGGETRLRHEILMSVGREDLSLARLAEAHWDAVAILAEAGREPERGALYGVWASEIPGQALRLHRDGIKSTVSGTKMFCSGAGLVDRALVTVGAPDPYLVDLDVREVSPGISFDESGWKTDAFVEVKTAKATFEDVPCRDEDIIGDAGWYLSRPGFWHGACGPAACWAGGAEGILDYAMQQTRSDPHTLAHLGAIHASVWALHSYMKDAGHEIDDDPLDGFSARMRARTVRHLVEVACTDILRRLTRAYGPHPLAMDEIMSRRCLELDLYLRQSHAERDLEALGRDVIAGATRTQ
jgi:hypothetical protein